MGWQAVAAAGGAAMSSAGGLIGQHMANKANVKLQQKQLDWNENMWHQQNEYNTPENQMNRMRDAGLHPMLALEGMGGGNSGAPAQGESPAQMDNVMEGFDPIGDYMSIKNASAGLENVKAETALKAKDLDLKELEIIMEGMNIEEKKIFLKDYRKRMGNETQISDLNVRSATLENVLKSINIRTGNQDIMSKDIQIQSDKIRLAYEEAKNILEVSNSYRDLKGTILQNKISREQYKYMKDNKMEMGKASPLIAVISGIIGGEDNNMLKNLIEKVLGFKIGSGGKEEVTGGGTLHPNMTKEELFGGQNEAERSLRGKIFNDN